MIGLLMALIYLVEAIKNQDMEEMVEWMEFIVTDKQKESVKGYIKIL